VEENPIEVKKIKKRNFMFPWWFKIIAYILSLFMISVSIFFIIIKGITFGNEKCAKWLTSIVVSLFTSVFLTQPIQVMLLSTFLVLIFRKSNDTNDLEYDHGDDGSPINKVRLPTWNKDLSTNVNSFFPPKEKQLNF
jgi:hypothetical protein